MNRELFEVRVMQGSVFVGSDHQILPASNIQKGAPLNISTCNYGDFYHNNNERVFSLCLSNRQAISTANGGNYISVNAVYCRYECPQPDQETDNGGCGITQ